MLFRLLLWIVLIAAAIWFWRKLHQPKPTAGRAQEAPPMIRCAHCGVHIPKADALPGPSLWYCCQKHLEQGPGRP